MNRIVSYQQAMGLRGNEMNVELKHAGHTRCFRRRRFARRDYGVTWRCWELPPTRAERMTPWMDRETQELWHDELMFDGVPCGHPCTQTGRV